jgi:hypothetical protein
MLLALDHYSGHLDNYKKFGNARETVSRSEIICPALGTMDFQ